MPLGRVLLLLASTSVGAFAGAAANVDCARIRAGNTRLLHLADLGLYEPLYLDDHSGLIAAGWRLGVLHRKCESANVRPIAGCGVPLPPPAATPSPHRSQCISL
jgi:hypothetical protein